MRFGIRAEGGMRTEEVGYGCTSWRVFREEMAEFRIRYVSFRIGERPSADGTGAGEMVALREFGMAEAFGEVGMDVTDCNGA